jgi:hypothetical protein
MDKLERVLAETHQAQVSSRRSMMVLRANMDTTARIVGNMGEDLAALDGQWLAIIDKALEAARRSRETVALCDALLAAPGVAKKA